MRFGVEPCATMEKLVLEILMEHAVEILQLPALSAKARRVLATEMSR